MISMELNLCRDRYAKELESLKMEKVGLEGKLQEASMRDEDLFDNYDTLQQSLETARDLQEKLDSIHIEMDDREKQHQEMYLTMFKKGKETARRELEADFGEDIYLGTASDLQEKLHMQLSKGSSRSDLSDEEVVLRFLRDAVYYYLVGSKDSRDHLQAIMSILKFSEKQRQEVHKIKGI